MECPLIALNCLSNLSLTNSRIQQPTIDSNTFESVEVKDIGRRSDSILLDKFVLGIGTSLVFFNMIGTIPSHTDVLNMALTGSASQAELLRMIEFGIVSEPHDLLVLKLLSFIRSTVYMVQ